MRTSSSIATISYNSDEYLDKVLNGLVERGVIDLYFWVYHFKENDELKDHKHLWLMPSSRIDTISLKSEFIEYDGINSLPLGVVFFKKSKFVDALLYFLHDEDYLRSKGLERVYHYDLVHDLHTNNFDQIYEEYKLIDWSNIERHNPAGIMKDAIIKGVSFEELCCRGVVPAQQVVGWEKMYNAIKFQISKYSQ